MKNIENISIGHPSIDDHHDEIFRLDNSLDMAIAHNSSEKVEEILQFLERYVVEHFNEEEELMAKNDYDGLDHHQKEHAFFKRRASEIRLLFDQNRHLTHVVFKIRHFIDTLIDHIIEIDSQMRHLEKEA